MENGSDSKKNNADASRIGAPIGGDVTHLLDRVAGGSPQYDETGRQNAAVVALARWPLLREIHLAASTSRK